jgi:Cysteine-rich secretory protein family
MLLSNRTRRMMWFLSSLSVADYDDGPNYDSLACAILFPCFVPSGSFSLKTSDKGGLPLGEVIHQGPISEPTADSFKTWLTTEKANYNGQTVTVDNAALIGHYAQMVTSRDSAIGCGTADVGDKHYVVCRYRQAAPQAVVKIYIESKPLSPRPSCGCAG